MDQVFLFPFSIAMVDHAVEREREILGPFLAVFTML
jgi:hypothetical protein